MINQTKIILITNRLQVFIQSLIVIFVFTTISLNHSILSASDLGRKLGPQLSATPDKGSFALIKW